jgi:hypothetical protein
MPSSYSASLRVELQFTGENLNLWGDKLNAGLSRLDSAIAGWTAVALTADYTLTVANGSADEARSAMLKFTGTGAFTVTIPSVSKQYTIWNACTGALTITTGAGATVVLQTGDKRVVFSEGTAVYELGFGGVDIKTYADNLAFTANAGNLPAQAGNSGKVVSTNGTVASWVQLTTSYLSDYAAQRASDQALAVALATAL